MNATASRLRLGGSSPSVDVVLARRRVLGVLEEAARRKAAELLEELRAEISAGSGKPVPPPRPSLLAGAWR